MNDKLKTGFADRMKTAADAKKALLANFKPKPTQIDPDRLDRAEERAAELIAVRQARAEAKVAKAEAAANSEAARLQAEADADEAALIAKRGDRKERKALTNAEAKAKRDAKYAARKTRR